MEKYFDLILEGKLDEADQYMHMKIPSKLYKYIGLSDPEPTDTKDQTINESKFATLDSNSFYFSPFEQLNDPYEFQTWHIDGAEMEKGGYPQHFIHGMQERFDMRNRFTVACLSGNDENNLPMWAYYTNNYRGFCVEYEVTDFKLIHKVAYADKRLGADGLYIGLFIATARQNENSISILSRLISESVYIKHQSWSWENEYRIVKLTDDPKTGQNVPLKMIGLKTKKVIAGYRCNPQHEDRLKLICKQNDFEFKKAVISNTSFGFEEA